MALLEVKNIRKSFGKTEVLKGIDFSLNKGEVMSIIGSSGSGKTTLLRCLNFLELADMGSVYVEETPIFTAEKRYRDSELRANRLNFGLVFQGFNLFPQYTALKNVLLPLEMQTREKCKKEKKSAVELKVFLNMAQTKAKRLLIKMGLGDRMNNYPCELSGGQCQRVAIARALALEPKILCFDEPTSALDPELTGEVLKVIRELKSPERAMVIVTHEMQFAKEVSDKVIFMAGGVIEEMGTPQEIFENPHSEKLKSFLRNYAHNA